LNSRGEVERDVGKATLDAATKAIIRALLSLSDNKTAVVPWGKNPPPTVTPGPGDAPALTTLTGLGERTVQRSLATALRYGWFTRHASPRGTIAGELRSGTDAGAGQSGKICQGPKCTRKLTGKRAHALYCSPRCQKAGVRAIERLRAKKKAAIDLGETRTLSGFPDGTQRQETRTVPSSERAEGHLSLERVPKPGVEPTEVPAAAIAKGEPSQRQSPLRSDQGAALDGPGGTDPLDPGRPSGTGPSIGDGLDAGDDFLTGSFPQAAGFQAACGNELGGGLGGGYEPPAQPPQDRHPDFCVSVTSAPNLRGRAGMTAAAARRDRLTPWYTAKARARWSVRAMAAELGLPDHVVAVDLKILGIRLARAHAAVTDMAKVRQARELLAAGRSLAAVAKETGLPKSTVYRYAQEMPEWRRAIERKRARAAAAERSRRALHN
jgi:hypothetical protein